MSIDWSEVDQWYEEVKQKGFHSLNSIIDLVDEVRSDIDAEQVRDDVWDFAMKYKAPTLELAAVLVLASSLFLSVSSEPIDLSHLRERSQRSLQRWGLWKRSRSS